MFENIGMTYSNVGYVVFSKWGDRGSEVYFGRILYKRENILPRKYFMWYYGLSSIDVYK